MPIISSKYLDYSAITTTLCVSKVWGDFEFEEVCMWFIEIYMYTNEENEFIKIIFYKKLAIRFNVINGNFHVF